MKNNNPTSPVALILTAAASVLECQPTPPASRDRCTHRWLDGPARRVSSCASLYRAVLAILTSIGFVLGGSGSSAHAQIPAGAWGFNEGDGTRTFDVSGNCNVGTLSGNTLWVPTAQHGPGLSFDGSADSVQTASSSSLNIGGTALTVSFWAWVDDTTGTDMVILAKPWNSGSQTSPAYQYAVEYSTQNNTAAFSFGTSTGTGRGPYLVSMTPNTWTYVTFTYDGSFVRGYSNGALILTAAASGSIAQRATALRMGVDSIGNQGLKGRLDDVRIYSRVLSFAEIQSDMNTGVGAAVDTTPPGNVKHLIRTDTR